MPSALQRYNAVRAHLQQQAPGQWQDILTLCHAVPDDITADTLWTHGKDKPCYANMRSEVAAGSNTLSQGQRMAHSLKQCPDMAHAATIASAAWAITDHRTEHFTKNTNYTPEGAAVQQFLAGQGQIFAKYLWRLNATRGLALALQGSTLLACVRTLQNDASVGTFNLQVAHMQQVLAGYAKGWGPVSILHWLTDLGLAVKPDVHLKASAVALGLVDSAAKDLAVVHAVKAFAQQVQGDAAHAPNSTLREVDKVLMEASRLKLWGAVPA